MESLKIRDKKQSEEYYVEEIATQEHVEETPKTAEANLEQTIPQPIEKPKPQPKKQKANRLTIGQKIMESVKKYFEEVE